MVRSIAYDPRIRTTKGIFFGPVLGLVGGVWSPISFVFHIENKILLVFKKGNESDVDLDWEGVKSEELKVGGAKSGRGKKWEESNVGGAKSGKGQKRRGRVFWVAFLGRVFFGSRFLVAFFGSRFFGSRFWVAYFQYIRTLHHPF